MNTIKTFESFVSDKDSTKVNENPAVAAMAIDKLTDAYDSMKEMMKKEALEIDGDESSTTANEAMCEMMKENAAMIGMAAKELTETMAGPPTDPTTEGTVSENPAVAMAAVDMIKEMKETLDLSLTEMMEMMKKEGAKEDIAAELISKELSK